MVAQATQAAQDAKAKADTLRNPDIAALPASPAIPKPDITTTAAQIRQLSSIVDLDPQAITLLAVKGDGTVVEVGPGNIQEIFETLLDLPEQDFRAFSFDMSRLGRYLIQLRLPSMPTQWHSKPDMILRLNETVMAFWFIRMPAWTDATKEQIRSDFLKVTEAAIPRIVEYYRRLLQVPTSSPLPRASIDPVIPVAGIGGIELIAGED